MLHQINLENFRDGIQFWNPGDVFGDDSRLFEPGEKEVRNPAIAMAIRRIAMCEQAGTGMRMMREEWQKLGHLVPTYKNDRSWKAFEFFIPELDKEVDMASDLMKAMFGRTDQVEAHEAHEAHVTPQVTPQGAPQVLQLLSVLKGAKNRDTLQRALGLKARKNFRLLYLVPALEAGLIEMTIPDKPQSSKQKYRLTDKGRKLIQD